MFVTWILLYLTHSVPLVSEQQLWEKMECDRDTVYSGLAMHCSCYLKWRVL